MCQKAFSLKIAENRNYTNLVDVMYFLQWANHDRRKSKDVKKLLFVLVGDFEKLKSATTSAISYLWCSVFL